MGALHRKLHEQRGASMLMALFLLLVALMVSAVVIAAASSAATTLRSDKAQEQSSLAVSSAAEYVRDAFLGKEMDGTITTDYWTGSASYSSDSGGAFRDFVSYAVPELYRNQNALPRRTYRLRLSDDTVEDVWADFEMSFGQNENTEYPTYILTVTLRNWETTPGEHPCSMTLLLCSNLTERSQWSYTYTDVTWDGYNVIQR